MSSSKRGSPRNVLVTGGAGFIGSNLAEMLVKDGHKVVVLDNLFLGKEDNLARIRSRIVFYSHGYEDKEFLRGIVKKHSIDCIFHFAGLSSAPMFDMSESEGMSMNVVGFVKMLEVCRDEKVKRVVYASSSSIYGDAPRQEESVKVMPPNFYALAKYSMEHISRLFYDLYNVESIGLRFFSVYGRNEKHKIQYANLVSQFLWAIQEGKEVVIYGDGSQTRDFVYVLDLCRALIAGMEADSRFARAGVYNVGTSESHSLNHMIDVLETLTGLKARRRYIGNPIRNYVAHTRADTSKVLKDLGFKSVYSLEEGIKDLLDTQE